MEPWGTPLYRSPLGYICRSSNPIYFNKANNKWITLCNLIKSYQSLKVGFAELNLKITALNIHRRKCFNAKKKAVR